MKRPKARVGALITALLALAGAARPDGAAQQPQTAAAPAVVKLKDGRLLHNVKVMADEGTSVVIRADEGLLKVLKTSLPAEFVAAESVKPAPAPGSDYVMQSFNPNQAPQEGDEPKAPPVTPTPVPVAGAVYRGCSITSFQPRSFQSAQGCAELTIHNESDAAAELRPAEIVCVDAGDGRHPARAFVTTAFPPAIQRRALVPPNGDLDVMVIFTNESLTISAIRWIR